MAVSSLGRLPSEERLPEPALEGLEQVRVVLAGADHHGQVRDELRQGLVGAARRSRGLAPEAPPQSALSSAREPLAQLVAHLAMVVGAGQDDADLFEAFQRGLGLPLFAR